MANEITTARTNIAVVSWKSPAPYACAVSPLVPIRIKEQFQYIKLNIDTPRANAPITAASPLHRPTMAVETKPINGTVIFEMIFGIAMRKISLFILDIAKVTSSICCISQRIPKHP